jgi:hypothetical protein
MIVEELEGTIFHLERYKCPQCGQLRVYKFTRRKSDSKYPCDAYCEKCDVKYKAIDQNHRCRGCKERVECFVNFPIVLEETDSYTPPSLSRRGKKP